MFKNNKQHTGYWLASQSTLSDLETETPHSLTVGQKIKVKDSKPPWIIVCKTIPAIIVTSNSWPCSLWRANVTKLGDMSNLVADPGYWRAGEIELIEELPVATLFGANGDKIIPLLNQITTLTLLEVYKLYENKGENSCAEATYAHGWHLWNKGLEHPRSHTYESGSTLRSPSRHDKEESPTNYGFSLIYALFWQQARKLEGDAAFVEYIEYDQTELELTPHWSAACTAFLHKAMALSMAEHLSDGEYSDLVRLWVSVFGLSSTKG